MSLWHVLLIAWLAAVVIICVVAAWRRQHPRGDCLIMTRRIAERGAQLRQNEVDRDFAVRMTVNDPQTFRIARRR